MKKYIIIFVVILFVAICVAGLVYLEFGNVGNSERRIDEPVATSTPVGGQVACMEEAILCPDGSYVGRSGPNCDFETCPNTSITTPEPVACTMEAKQCPDGSYVGRQGPKCEFAPCPEAVEKTCPQLAPVSPDFCPNGKIEFGGVNADGCQLPPKCVN